MAHKTRDRQKLIRRVRRIRLNPEKPKNSSLAKAADELVDVVRAYLR